MESSDSHHKLSELCNWMGQGGSIQLISRETFVLKGRGVLGQLSRIQDCTRGLLWEVQRERSAHQKPGFYSPIRDYVPRGRKMQKSVGKSSRQAVFILNLHSLSLLKELRMCHLKVQQAVLLIISSYKSQRGLYLWKKNAFCLCLLRKNDSQVFCARDFCFPYSMAKKFIFHPQRVIIRSMMNLNK